MPLSTEVDLGPGHIVLDGVPAARESGTAATTELLLWPPYVIGGELYFCAVVCYGRPMQ